MNIYNARTTSNIVKNAEALGAFPLSGAMLYVFDDLDQKTWDEALEKGEYNGDVQSSRILYFPSGYLSSDVPLVAELETPLREHQDLVKSWYLIDFGHDPHSKTNPTLFGPRDPDSLASVDSYIDTYAVPYYWESDKVRSTRRARLLSNNELRRRD